ncbi:MAG: hypothetical protein IPL55_07815 [Saprospiraceae bacterium]|nr:hypothetical protein [Saprospiraceae bacterium]
MNKFPLNQILFIHQVPEKPTIPSMKLCILLIQNIMMKIKQIGEKLRSFYTDKLIVDWDTAKGHIGFCTFHQSFSYEDFVEGIKPVEPSDGDTYLKYKIEEGIFKRMCRLANDGLRSADIKRLI